MSEKKKSVEKLGQKQSNKELGKLIRIILLLGIIVVSGFIIYYILNPEPGFVSFGILNEDEKAENYPTEASVGEEVEFYITVGNFLTENLLEKELTFRLRVYKGDEDTKLKSTGVEDADFDFKTKQRTLEYNEEWTSKKMSVDFSEVGEDQILIVELYQITDDDKEEFNNILWIRLNITA